MNGPKQKLVSVDEASISTLSVEIKTVSVGRRQMSMALFRQLPCEPLIDLKDVDLRLNGMAWGRVNYHWDGCYRAPKHFHPSVNVYEHIHVLWQRDSMLLQSPVPKVPAFPDDREHAKRLEKDCDVLVDAGALLCAITTDAEITEITGAKLSFAVGDWTVHEDWQRPLFKLLREFRAAPEVKAVYDWHSKDEKRKEIEKRIADLCHANVLDVPTTEDEACEMYDTTTEALGVTNAADQHRRDLYTKRYQELLALEQLFISA